MNLQDCPQDALDGQASLPDEPAHHSLAADWHHPSTYRSQKGHLASHVHTGTKIKVKPSPFQRNTQRNSRHPSKGDEAREILANTLLNHVPVVRYNFQAKVGRLATRLCSTHK